MSDQQVTDQESQPKAKHPGGRPRKPKPAPPLPPPAPYSLEETLLMGDAAALKAGASPASQLRWYSDRVQIVKQIQAKVDAARHDTLEIDNKRLQETIEASKKTQQNFENELRERDRDLVEARAENDRMSAKLKEMSDEHAEQVGELTDNVRATQRKAEGLLALVRCVCLQMEQYSEGERIQYAARLMCFSEQAHQNADQLERLVNNAEAHRKQYADMYWKAATGPIEQKLTSEQFADFNRSQEERIERSMQADRERLALQFSRIVPEEVMNQAFELLSVTRKQVLNELDMERQ